MKRNKLVPKSSPFTFCAPPVAPRPPRTHSGAPRGSEVLAGLFHFVPPIEAEPHKCYAPHSRLAQSSPKRSFVSRMAHFALGPNSFSLSLAHSPSLLFIPQPFFFIVCLLNDTITGCNSRRLVHLDELLILSSICVFLDTVGSRVDRHTQAFGFSGTDAFFGSMREFN